MSWVYDIEGLGDQQIAWLTDAENFDLGDGEEIETGVVIAPGTVRLSEDALDALRERCEHYGWTGREVVGDVGWSGHGPTVFLPHRGGVREWEMIDRWVNVD